MIETNARIASTKEAPTAGDSAHTTYGREKSSKTARAPRSRHGFRTTSCAGITFSDFPERARSIVSAMLIRK
jgi:hypothetical protein